LAKHQDNANHYTTDAVVLVSVVDE
jgi:hypothetical protein